MPHRPSRNELRISKVTEWGGQRKGFLLAVLLTFVMLQLLFLANMCLLYGSQYEDTQKTHKLHVLAVDYDGGIVGQALFAAYQRLKAPSFPTLDIQPASSYPDVKMIEHSICKGDYWAAIYSLPGASSRLAAALQGSEATYNSSETLRYVWNEARYTTAEESFVASNLETLVAMSRNMYARVQGIPTTVNRSDSAALDAFSDPIRSSSINIKPTHQGTRVLYNSASMALSIVEQFFFIMVINGISQSTELFSRLTPLTNGIIRHTLATAYTLTGSLCWTAYIWAYKEDWVLSGKQFMLIWLTGWMYMYINFLVLDLAAVFIAMQFMPFFVLTWIVSNITSSLTNFPLAAAFYRYGYAMPAHNWYQVFIHIVSGGNCYNRLYRALPVLLAWLAVGQVAIVPATLHRCRLARLAEQHQAQMVVQASSADTVDKAISNTAVGEESVEVLALEPFESHKSQVYSPSMPLAFESLEGRL